MTALLQTSGGFACAIASGHDWRDVGRKMLEQLESVRTPDDGMTIGFVYATQEMAPNMDALLALLRGVTRVSKWFGSSGQGICGCGVSVMGQPAAVAIIGRFPEGAFQAFTLGEDPQSPLPASARLWLSGHMPVAALTHGILCAPAAHRLNQLRDQDGLYTVGGFASGAAGGLHIADGAIIEADKLSGVLIDSTVRVMTATSFGCAPTGIAGHITACSGNTIETINGLPAFDVLRSAMDTLQLDEEAGARHGHVHAAFPVAGADTGALLLRNITQADEKNKTLTVAHSFDRGDAIRFVYRDRLTAMSDLSQVMTGLYARACAEIGASNLKPKALLYFGCGARLPEADGREDEAALIGKIFDGVPMAGFYTAAEICNGHVYGYTGVAVLFL